MILYVIHCPPPIHGASIVGQQIVSSRFINDSMNVRVINISYPRLDKIGKLTLGKLFWHLNLYWLFIITLLKHENIDKVYLTISASQLGLLRDIPFILLSRILGKKIYLHCHNKGFSSLSRFGQNVFSRLVRNTEIIVLSETLRYDLNFLSKNTNIVVCNNGTKAMRNVTPVKNDRLKVLFFSNLYKDKGVLRCLKALERISFSMDMTIAGNNGDITLEELKYEASLLNLSPNINLKFKGATYGNEKEALFKSSNVVLFPTWYEKECFPLTILEAMSSYNVVVSTNNGGIVDIIDNNRNGLIIDGNSISIASALHYLNADKNLIRELSYAAFIKWESRFELSKFETRFRNIIKGNES